MEDMLKQADELTTTIGIMQRMQDLMQQMVDTTHRWWKARTRFRTSRRT